MTHSTAGHATGPIAPPVAIGGVGGSGTRVVADILIRAGFYLGSDLNESLDNLWFTLLFVRPRWLRRTGGRQVGRAIDIFERAMLRRSSSGTADRLFTLAAALPMTLSGHDHNHLGRGRWPLDRAANLLGQGAKPEHQPALWGWKEPNTHIYLEHLAARYPGLRYIHTIRHGLDMAYSSNQAQLFNWAHLFGVRIPGSAAEIPRASFDYWLRANEKAISVGRKHLGERFLLINFDKLCDAPEQQVAKIVSFLGLAPAEVNLETLTGLIRKPRSIGRHRAQDLSAFHEEDFAAVQRLGFPAEDPK